MLCVTDFTTGGLLTVPLDKQYKAMRSLPKRFKEWIAERIANNMIESQFAEINSDVESETETSTSFQHQSQQQQTQCEFFLPCDN